MIITVLRDVVEENAATGQRRPPISIGLGRHAPLASRVKITGPCELIYAPDAPLPNGARVWVETEADVLPLG